MKKIYTISIMTTVSFDAPKQEILMMRVNGLNSESIMVL
jgi:hypothetical protein